MDKNKYPDQARKIEEETTRKENSFDSDTDPTIDILKGKLNYKNPVFYIVWFQIITSLLGLYSVISRALLVDLLSDIKFIVVIIFLLSTYLLLWIGGLLMYKKKKSGVTLSIAVHLLQLFTVKLSGWTYTLSPVVGLFLYVSTGITFGFDANFGVEYDITHREGEEVWKFGINIVTLLIIGTLGLYLETLEEKKEKEMKV